MGIGKLLLVGGGVVGLGLLAASASSSSTGAGGAKKTGGNGLDPVLNKDDPGGKTGGLPDVGGGGVSTYTVKAGDTEWSIAQKFTGSGSRYPELEKANPQKPVGYSYKDPSNGQYYTRDKYEGPTIKVPVPWTDDGYTTLQYMGTAFKTLSGGEVLNLPASWGSGSASA